MINITQAKEELIKTSKNDIRHLNRIILSYLKKIFIIAVYYVIWITNSISIKPNI